MVESVPTVFIMSFALAVTGGKGVITEEGSQNLFSAEVSFLCYWTILVTGKSTGATLPLYIFDLNCLGNSGHDQTTQVGSLQNPSIGSVPSFIILSTSLSPRWTLWRLPDPLLHPALLHLGHHHGGERLGPRLAFSLSPLCRPA